MNAYIIAAHRTAVGKAPKGVFKNTRPDDLAVAVIKHLLTVVPQLDKEQIDDVIVCLLYTSPSPRDRTRSRMPSSA